MGISTELVPFNPELVDLIVKILSVAETGETSWDSGATYFYDDGPNQKNQATLAIGFTASGNLVKVLETYVDRGGSFAAQFAPFITMLHSGNLLPKNQDFATLCRQAAQDPLFKEVQTDCFKEFYLTKAFAWASKHGFGLPLSYLVIADSFLHSGSMLDFLMNRFAEKKPSDGGDEKSWIKDYTATRKDWLANHSKQVLRNTVYRCNCYLVQIDKSNWNLEQTPLVMHGTEVA